MKVHVTSSTLQIYPVQPQTRAAATVLVLAIHTLVSSGTASASVTTTTVTMVKQLTVILHVMVMQTSCVVERGPTASTRSLLPVLTQMHMSVLTSGKLVNVTVKSDMVLMIPSLTGLMLMARSSAQTLCSV